MTPIEQKRAEIEAYKNSAMWIGVDTLRHIKWLLAREKKLTEALGICRADAHFIRAEFFDEGGHDLAAKAIRNIRSISDEALTFNPDEK